LERGVGKRVEVTYGSKEESYVYEQEQKEKGDVLLHYTWVVSGSTFDFEKRKCKS